MSNKEDLLLITNFCPHYRVRTLEHLARVFNARFVFFSDGTEEYWERSNQIQKGGFDHIYLKGIAIAPKFRVTPGLFGEIAKSKSKVIVQSLAGRFAVPIGFILSRVFRKKFILWTGLWYHPQSFFHRLTWPLTLYLYKHSDALIVYGTHVRRFLESHGVPSERIFEFWQAVDVEKLGRPVDTSTVERYRQQFSPDGLPILLFVGRLDEVKGLDSVIRASKIAQTTSPHHLVFVGQGPEKDKLETLAKEISTDLMIHPFIPNPELPEVYAACDSFVLASRSLPMVKEAWGLVLNEAMLQGCIPTASNAVGAAVGGLFDSEMQSSLIFQEDNVEDMSRKFISALIRSRDNSSKQKMKEIASTFTPEKQSSGLIKAMQYLKLIT